MPLEVQTTGMPSTLALADFLKLEKSHWIDQLTAERLGLYRVSSAEGKALVGRDSDNHEDYAGIIFSVYFPGQSSIREKFLRRDHPPIENGKARMRYVGPPGRGNKLLFGPGEPVEALTDTTIPIVLVEGLKKLCATYRLSRYESEHPRFLPCAISGAWNWKGTVGKTTDATGARVDEKGVIPNFDRIAWSGRDVVVVFDSDVATNPSIAAARRGLCSELKRRGARVSVVDLPALEGLNITGFDDFLAQRGPEEGLQLIQKAMMSHAPEPRTTGDFSPMSLAQLLDEPESLEPDWTLEDLLAAGDLAALVSKPKVGKTTLVYELAVAVSQGRVFLGRATKRGHVLILAMEEHRREVKRRLRDLGADQLDAIHVHAGPLSDSPDTIHTLADFIKQHGIVLVIFDTLNAFWSVSEENDAVAVTRAIKPLLQLARESSATVLLIHHARKAEGEYGDEIRGSGALFSLLDVAFVLKRHAVDKQRRLTIISRYPETSPELLLELREHGYVSLGDPAASHKAAKLAKLANALTDAPMGVKNVAVKAELSTKATYALLNLLAQQGKAVKSGTGKKGDPFLFSKFVSVSVSTTVGLEETNGLQSTLSTKGLPLGEEFVSSYPSTIGVETKEAFSGGYGDSFLPTPVPPGSNESEPEEEVIDL